MTYDRFLTDVDYSNWLSMNGLQSWHIANYKGRYVLLLYRQNDSYGMALEANDRLQGHGYDIITNIEGLPAAQYEVIQENNTMTRLLNEDEFREIGIRVAQELDAAFNRSFNR